MDKPRIEPRTNAIVQARLRCAKGERALSVLDASSRGLRAMIFDPPERGEFVEIVVGPHALVGQVRWRVGKRFGLRFRDRISVPALLEGGRLPLLLAGQVPAVSQRKSAFLNFADSLSGRMLLYGVLVVCACAAAFMLHAVTRMGLAPLAQAEKAMAQEPSSASPEPVLDPI